jgi:hypothetical protein
MKTIFGRVSWTGAGAGPGGGGGGGGGGGVAGQWHSVLPHCGQGLPSGHVSGGVALGLHGIVGGPGGGGAGQ